MKLAATAALVLALTVGAAWMERAADRAVRRGWLLPPDARDQMRRVCTVRARYPAGSRGACRDYRPPTFGSA